MQSLFHAWFTIIALVKVRVEVDVILSHIICLRRLFSENLCSSTIYHLSFLTFMCFISWRSLHFFFFFGSLSFCFCTWNTSFILGRFLLFPFLLVYGWIILPVIPPFLVAAQLSQVCLKVMMQFQLLQLLRHPWIFHTLSRDEPGCWKEMGMECIDPVQLMGGEIFLFFNSETIFFFCLNIYLATGVIFDHEISYICQTVSLFSLCPGM